ncbi:hypothetical protein WDW89_16625, partial [Deltaproteobacteria bacterium TL4]
RDERWIEYTKKTAQTQNSTRQTALFPLSPPSQKTKARYMNLNKNGDRQIKMGTKNGDRQIIKMGTGR